MSPRRPVTRHAIASAALGLADDQGLQAVSMRRVAALVGVEAMSLYHHVAGISDLCAAMLDLILQEETSYDDLGDGDPAEVMFRLANRFRERGQRHRCMLPLLIRVEQHSVAVQQEVERVLETLGRAGLSPEEAAVAYQSLLSFTLGFMFQDDHGTLGLTCCADGTKQDLSRQLSGSDPHQQYSIGLRALIKGLQLVRSEYATDLAG